MHLRHPHKEAAVANSLCSEVATTLPQDRRQWFVLDHHFVRRCATDFLRLADDKRDDLAVIRNLISREQRFVVANRTDVIQPGNIFRSFRLEIQVTSYSYSFPESHPFSVR